MKCRIVRILGARPLVLFVLFVLCTVSAMAQDGKEGISSANTQIRGYFDVGTQLMYGIGAVLALIGAVKVYQKWNAGEQDTSKVAASWFGSCIFLVVVVLIIRSFFGITA
ncbi:MAG: DUF4134 domain-containing protein [Candidatus Pseudobacter hemicellulosilyticus]|uniref:DUF4134 domain-containing protein n=1 Tax=Candidatus Pseudobacter hemicellulosilyticus TaxID=3121375 RepID=A0AAJ5WVX0_9BACT|nr:MAG: DUF4134 domain-containing protein [Pseudobacter sp.]